MVSLSLLLILSSEKCNSFENKAKTAQQVVPISGDSTIKAGTGSKQIVVTTTSRLAGAIHSITYNGKEFIDSTDHGRQLQSASSFNCGLSTPFWAECFNPTEAGSAKDAAGQSSTSRLLSIEAKGNHLKTVTQMAFWLSPGENSAGHRALNQSSLSEHILTKEVTIGEFGSNQLLNYKVEFRLPKGEKHTFGQFESLTGYMPIEFSDFWCYNPVKKELAPLDDGPGEQAFPVILATPSGEHAMGIYSPNQPSNGFSHAGYGRFRFSAEKVVKWNCVFRETHPFQLRTGPYKYQMYVAIGTLKEVQGLIQLAYNKCSKP